MVGVRRTDPPEKRRLALMRQVSGKQNGYTISGRQKQGGYAPRPITLPTAPWKDDKSGDDDHGSE